MMQMQRQRRGLFAAGLWLVSVSPVAAQTGGFEFFTNETAWNQAVGEFSTITFCEFPVGTLIADQYAGLGVVFDSPADIIQHAPAFFDGCGLDLNPDTFTVFARDQYWFGMRHPGTIQFKVYRDNHLIYISPVSSSNFSGLVASVPFDTVNVFDPKNKGDIDDLFFGPPPCLADVNIDDVVDTDDLVEVIVHWSCGAAGGDDGGKDPCIEFDVTRDGDVDVDDLVAVILNWGDCPQ